MMYYLILFISFVIFAILLKVKGSIFRNLAINSVSLVNTLLAGNEDDDETIKQVQASTSKLLSSLLNLMILIVSASVVASVPLFIYVIAINYSTNINFLLERINHNLIFFTFAPMKSI